MQDKEATYDTLLNPLVAQIIAICKEHGIPFVASFQLTDGRDETGEMGEDGPLFCSSANIPAGSEERLTTCYNVLTKGVLAAWMADMNKAGLVPIPMRLR